MTRDLKSLLIFGLIILLAVVLVIVRLNTNTPLRSNTKMTDANQNSAQDYPFQLVFSAGGSIMGSTFNVKVYGGKIEYSETKNGGSEVVNKIDRDLTRAEDEDIQKIGVDLHYLGLQTAGDYKPASTDPANYDVTVLLDMKGSHLRCPIPAPDAKSMDKCQEQMDKLRVKLNEILDVKIY